RDSLFASFSVAMPPSTTPEGLADWDATVTFLAREAPLTGPGTGNAYHPTTFGFVLGEVVRQTDSQGRSFRQFVCEELCSPLVLENLYLGVPSSALERVAPLSLATMPPSAPLPPERVAFRTKVVPPAVELMPEVYNRADVLQACI